MSPAKARLLEDRAMRDAAKAVVARDVETLKSEARRKDLKDRLLSSGADYARSVADGAIDLITDNKRSVGTGVGLATVAILGWLFRAEIAEAVSGVVDGLTSGDDDDESLSER